MLFFRWKLLSVVPSCLTISDVDLAPPSYPPSKMIPLGSTLQDTWLYLFIWRVWPVPAQMPVVVLNCWQLCPAS